MRFLHLHHHNQAAIAPVPPAGGLSPECAAALEAAADLILAGRYHSVPESDCPLGAKIKEMAVRLEREAQGQLKLDVGLSINVNDAVTQAAGMMRDVSEVDRRSQAIAAAAEELVASVGDISRTSQAAADEAGAARLAAGGSERAAEEAVASMRQIARAVEDAARKVDALAEASSKIGDIVGQIEGIAKQTNMLALNATIEAARAGEAGKGFAVVAGEVKGLANQTAKATIDIKQRIDLLREEMAAIVASMKEGAVAVKHGEEVILATGEGMHRVVAQVEGVTARMQDIAHILGQQAEASTEVSKGISSIAGMAKHNVASIGQVLDVMDRSVAMIGESLNAMVGREIEDALIHVAKADHVVWRKKLADMVVGRQTLDPDELADHHHCRLGKWAATVADSSIRDHPAFKALEKPHAEVHAAGIEAAHRFKAGDLDGALACIERVAASSGDVLRCLDALAERRHGQHSSPAALH